MNSDDVSQALDEYRELGEVVEMQDGGRVPKYRHQLYEWRGVEKVELAVVTALLARWIGQRLLEQLARRWVVRPPQLQIAVDEDNGQGGLCELGDTC